MKKRLALSVVTLLMFLSVGLSAFGCNGGKKDDDGYKYIDTTVKTYTPTLSSSSKQLEIGVAGVQKWVFKNEGENWLFDGVYALDGKKSEKVFVGASGRVNEAGELVEDGAYFNVLSSLEENGLDKEVNGMIKTVNVTANTKEEKIVELSGTGFTSTLRVSQDSQFVERTISIKPRNDHRLDAGDVSFVFKGKVDEYTEYGYILSRKADDTQYSLPYSFPALAGRLTRNSDEKEFTYVNVIDYYDTADCFKTARRRTGINDYFEEGVLSSEGVLFGGEENKFTESVCVRKGEDVSFYDMIYDARMEYGRMYDLDVLTLLTANSNMNVYDWDEAAYGATYDIIDSRGRPYGDSAAWTPYGYSTSGVEATGSMDILAGIIRYAKATDNQDLYNFGLKFLLTIVEPSSQHAGCLVQPLNSVAAYSQYTSDYFFFLQCFGKSYAACDTYMGPGVQNFGSFKYFTRTAKLGELALITGNAKVKAAYLKLMVLLKRLHGENFEQPVEWGLDETPQLDFENGGSSGATAMWANCMYIASQITENEAEKAEYLDYMQKALDQANKQGFERSSALRNAPKPESVGYIARMNLVMYERTGDKEYLNQALKTARGIFFYYYHNTNPFTYFQTVGYGYACAHERWEAFWEMTESLMLLSPIFKYTNDPLLFDLYMTLRESALSTLPVNGFPEGVLGGIQDCLDALYVPFEQPTGVLGDNGLADGGGESYRRWSKELYGIGEVFTGALMFSVQGKAVDAEVLVLNYTSNWLQCSRTNNAYKLYNYGAAGDKIIAFPNYADGNYTVKADGKPLGDYTAAQLKNGIAIHLDTKVAVHVEIEPTKAEVNAATVNKNTELSVSDLQSDSATVQVTADGAAFYKLYISKGDGFEKLNTAIKSSIGGTFKLGFEDSNNLYLKAVAFDAKGNAYKESAAYHLMSKDVVVGAADDFGTVLPSGTGSIEGWTASSKIYGKAIQLITDTQNMINYPNDASKYKTPTGYMAVYKPAYRGYDVDTFTKSFTVDLDEYPLFDFYPFCKNFMSAFSLQVKAGGKTYTLIDKVQGFSEPNYRFNLKELTSLSGEQKVEVVMVSEGFNRGFAVKGMRFVKEVAYAGYYDLTQLDFKGTAETDLESGLFTVTNGTSLAASNEFTLPKFDPSLYTEMNIAFNGMTTDQNGFINAQVKISRNGTEVYSKTVNQIKSGASITLKVADVGFDKNAPHAMEVVFKRGNTAVTNIKVQNVRLVSTVKATDTEGFNPDLVGFNGEKGFSPAVVQEENEEGVMQWQIANGWKINAAYPSATTGYIRNESPSQGYGSIYKTNIYVDLAETPVIRFSVSYAKGCIWALKCNDGAMAVDVTLRQGSDTGVFQVNLSDAFKGTGVVHMRLDFYVQHNKTDKQDVGAFFDGFALIYGTTLYENQMTGVYSVMQSEAFSVNTDKTNYLTVDLPNKSYGSKWFMYVIDEDGVEYEVRTVYEKAYRKMYSRSKMGVFRYELTDILPAELCGKDTTLKLKIVLDGAETFVTFGAIRLGTNNDTCVLQRPCTVR